jgi:pimeloyl-ACP methyl ester carboxylesterase
MVSMNIAARPIIAATLTTLALASLACAVARPGEAAAQSRARTSSHARVGLTTKEAARLVAQVPTPALHWTTCRKTAQCATAELPLNYHDPHGAHFKLALLKIQAKDPRHRLGTIFVNPGGPGDAARGFAFAVAQPAVLPKALLDRFDVVGVDPRGVGGSTPISCFATKAERTRAEAPFNSTPFPVTKAQQQSWIEAARKVGQACSTTARSVASGMSTTDDALDLDVLRRAVGDRKLTYLGESYGSYLGLIYANLFPSRVRAVVIDGIVNPQALVGTPGTARIPAFDRMGSAAASDRVLTELLKLCQQAGQSKCSFANANTEASYAALAAKLRTHSLRLTAPGIKPSTFSYAEMIADTEHWLHAPNGYKGLFPELTALAQLTAPGGGGSGHAALVRALLQLHQAVQGGPAPANQLEAQSGAQCADTLNAENASSWPAAASAADQHAKYFGAYYAWVSVQCARTTWTVSDPDVYLGPFDHRTAAPVLVIGGLWDPVTSYANAVQVARRLPGSRLVASDNWGHESLATSACVDNAAFSYLLHPLARAPKVTHCRGDIQPFAPNH